MPAIENDAPVTAPASAEKTFPNLWVANIIIHAPSADVATVTIKTKPFNAATGEIKDEYLPSISADLWELASPETEGGPPRVPAAAIAMGAVLDAVKPIKEYLAAKEAARLAALEAAQNPQAPQ